jgi:hypothetical protein
MLDRNMLIGIFLAKGNFLAKIELSETTTIGYHIRLESNISLRTKEMKEALSRTLTMYGLKHSRSGSQIRLSRKSTTEIVNMIPRSLHHLNSRLVTFRTVLDLVEDKQHKTLDGLNRIIEILYGESDESN